jgi:hypothetical protein
VRGVPRPEEPLARPGEAASARRAEAAWAPTAEPEEAAPGQPAEAELAWAEEPAGPARRPGEAGPGLLTAPAGVAPETPGAAWRSAP